MKNRTSKTVKVFTSRFALTRPAWRQDDLHSFNHREYTHRGMRVLQKDFYKDRSGII